MNAIYDLLFKPIFQQPNHQQTFWSELCESLTWYLLVMKLVQWVWSFYSITFDLTFHSWLDDQ